MCGVGCGLCTKHEVEQKDAVDFEPGSSEASHYELVTGEVEESVVNSQPHWPDPGQATGAKTLLDGARRTPLCRGCCMSQPIQPIRDLKLLKALSREQPPKRHHLENLSDPYQLWAS